MLGHTHVVIAGVSWAAVWWRPLEIGRLALIAPEAPIGAGLPPVVSTLALVALGALVPDLDHPGAFLAQFRPAGRQGFGRFFRPFFAPSVALRSALGHRGALHSLVGAALICAGVELVARSGGLSGVGAAVGWGYVTHLLADMATRRGVPLLWPLAHWRFSVPRPLTVKTGSFGEALYLAAVSALAALHGAGVF